MPRTIARALHLKVLATLLVAAWAWMGQEAWAAPADPTATDPVLQLLQDRGFVSKESAPEGSPLVRQVRDVASRLVLSAMNFLGCRTNVEATPRTTVSTAVASLAISSR